MLRTPQGPIVFTNVQLSEMATDAWQVLSEVTELKERLYRQDRSLVLLMKSERDETIVHPSRDELRAILARAAFWKKRKGLDQPGEDSFPPNELLADMLAIAPQSLPVLERVVQAPCFGEEWTPILTPGYHPGSRTFYDPAPELANLSLPNVITRYDVANARELFTRELLADFLFPSEADQAHAMALFLLPFVRDAISGPTPIHTVAASHPGVGKGLLTDLVSIVSTGRPCMGMTLPNGETSIRHFLVSELKAGRRFIRLDNLAEGRRLDSANLASLMTSEEMEDRVLHSQNTLRVKNRAVWVTTANNPDFSRELTRRSIGIRLESDQENPAERMGFKHPRLSQWAQEHRGELVQAALTLISAWIHAGKPRFTTRVMGSFEEWAECMGGILEVAGIPGFLDNRESFAAEINDEQIEHREFVEVWQQAFGLNSVGVTQLEGLCFEHGLLQDELGNEGRKSRQTRLGCLLRRLKGRVFSSWQIRLVRDDGHHGKRYSLTPVLHQRTTATVETLPALPCE